MGWFSKREKLPRVDIEFDSATGLPKLPPDHYFQITSQSGYFSLFLCQQMQGERLIIVDFTLIDASGIIPSNAAERVTKAVVVEAAVAAFIDMGNKKNNKIRTAEIVGSYPPKSIKDWS